LHRDSAQGYTRHRLYGSEDERESCPAHPFEFSEKEYDATLVLAQHAKRADKIEDYCNAENAKNLGPVHGVPIWLSK
jgi:hypothetical protein